MGGRRGKEKDGAGKVSKTYPRDSKVLLPLDRDLKTGISKKSHYH